MIFGIAVFTLEESMSSEVQRACVVFTGKMLD